MAVKKADLQKKLGDVAATALEQSIDPILEERFLASADGRVSIRMAEVAIPQSLRKNPGRLLEMLRKIYPDWLIDITTGPGKRIYFS